MLPNKLFLKLKLVFEFFSKIWDFSKTSGPPMFFFRLRWEKKIEISQKSLRLVNSDLKENLTWIHSSKMAGTRRLQHRRRRNLGVPWRIQDRFNPLEGLNDNEMFERYRFFHATIFFIVDSLKDNQFTSRRNNPFAPFHQVLVSLKFYATVPFYINNWRYFDHVKKHSWQGS